LQLCRWLYQKQLSSEKYRVDPWRIHPLFTHKRLSEGEAENQLRHAPPLLKAYLRIGVKVAGVPAWDQEMNTLDFLTLLNVKEIPLAMAQYFGLR
jgi:putative hemolysin